MSGVQYAAVFWPPISLPLGRALCNASPTYVHNHIEAALRLTDRTNPNHLTQPIAAKHKPCTSLNSSRYQTSCIVCSFVHANESICKATTNAVADATVYSTQFSATHLHPHHPNHQTSRRRRHHPYQHSFLPLHSSHEDHSRHHQANFPVHP